MVQQGRILAHSSLIADGHPTNGEKWAIAVIIGFLFIILASPEIMRVIWGWSGACIGHTNWWIIIIQAIIFIIIIRIILG